MKRVGVREFRDRATRYLAGDEVLAIERHGQPIGFYIPTGASPAESLAQALERLERTVQQVVGETGLSEEELGRLYDLSRPVPDRPRRRRGDPTSARSGPATATSSAAASRSGRPRRWSNGSRPAGRPERVEQPPVSPPDRPAPPGAGRLLPPDGPATL